MSETNEVIEINSGPTEQFLADVAKLHTDPSNIPVNSSPKPKKRPTAAESLAKQRAADAVKKAAKKPSGKGRKTSENRVRKPSKDGTTIHPTPKKPATEAKKTGPRKDPSELRMMQIRALKVLDGKTEPTDGLTMEQLAKAAKISPQVMKRGIGAVKSENRIAHDATNGFKSLLSRGMVKIAFDDEKGTVYYLGTLGDKAIEKNAEVIKAPPKVHAKPFSVNGEKKKTTKKKAPVASK